MNRDDKELLEAWLNNATKYYCGQGFSVDITDVMWLSIIYLEDEDYCTGLGNRITNKMSDWRLIKKKEILGYYDALKLIHSI